MCSEVDVDGDEQYLDDPIRIIDLDTCDNNFIVGHREQRDADIVDFGCVLDSKEDIVDQYTRVEKSRSSSLSPVTLYNTFNNATQTKMCQCVSVKIVDCNKYPWYYKKYMTQIIKRIINDNDELVQDVTAYDENTQDITNVETDKHLIDDDIIISIDDKISHELSTEVKAESSNETNEKGIIPNYKLKNLKPRQYLELQKAIKQRNMTKIDIKKNQGLIGIQIAHRKSIDDKIQDQTPKAKKLKKSEQGEKRETKLRESYVEAVDKVLADIGTYIIPVVDAKDNRVNLNKPLLCSMDKSKCSQPSIHTDKSTASKKSSVSIKCSLKVTSPNLLAKIKLKQGAKKNIVRVTEKQGTPSTKYFPMDSFTEKVETEPKLGNEFEIFKINSNIISKYQNHTNKANTKSTNYNNNIVQKPMPKSKKSKIAEETGKTLTEPKENFIEENEKIETNVITSSYSPILQPTSVFKTNCVNETFSTLKPASTPKNVDSIRDISNKTITKAKKSTYICEDSQNNDHKAKILLNISQGDLKSQTNTKNNINSKTGLKEQLVQRKHDDKNPKDIALEENKSDNLYITNEGVEAPNIQLNTHFSIHSKIQPKQPETSDNNKDATRKQRLLQIISIDNLNNFDNYIRRMKNNDVTVTNEVKNSTLIPPDSCKPSIAITSESGKNLNHKLSRTSERYDRDVNKSIKEPVSSIRNECPKKNNSGSAIILRPIQQTQYQTGDFTRLPLQTHVSNKSEHQRTVPMIPQQMLSNAAVLIRHQLSSEQLPPINPNIYNQPYNFMASRDCNGGDLHNTLNTNNMHSGMYKVNPNQYWSYGYPPPTVSSLPLQPPAPPVQEDFNQCYPSSHMDNSIIGINTDGVIKKINITTGPAIKDSEKLLFDSKDSIDSKIKIKYIPIGVQDFLPITNRIVLINELSKPVTEHSLVKNYLKRQFSSDKKKITHPPRQRPGPLSKKFKLNAMCVAELDTDESQLQNKKKRKQNLTGKDYSPSILPIPTYEQLLSQVHDPLKLNKPTPDFTKTDPRVTKEPIKISNASVQKIICEDKCGESKEDLKKISLHAYKERMPRVDNISMTKQDLKKFVNKKGKKNIANVRTQRRKIKPKYLPDAGNQNDEKDLGYDSDTTVKL